MMVLIRSAALMVALTLAAGSVRGQAFYVDASGGNDANDGLSPATAWQTLARVNTVTFLPGQRILLKRGGVWTGRLYPQGSGSAGAPVVVGAYGTGGAPLISTGGAALSSIRLSDQHHWEFENLELTNRHPTDSTSERYGVYVTGSDIGVLTHLVFRNLSIHNVNGDPTVKTCGGVFFEITGSATPSWFDSVIVEGCDIYDVSPVGIANTSTWATRTLTSNTNWYPSLHVMVRNNSIRRTVRNGIIIRVSKGAVIEHNILQECAITESGNAVFTFNCDSTVMQYNEAFLTRFNAGDEDAGGFDGDYRCKSTIIQFNYAHDNEYGAIVVVSDGTGATTFNDGAVVRYNVLKDNLNHIIRTSGNVTNTTVSNNTIVSGASLSPVKVVYHKSWGGYADATSYYNNIFEIQTPGSSYDLGASTNNTFDFNLFHGVHPASEPADAHKLTGDPLFVAPDSVGTGWSSAAGYRLQSASPAVDAGLQLPGHSPRDYLGGAVPAGSGVDRGAFEFQGSSPLPPAQGRLDLDGGFERQAPFVSLPGITSLTTGMGMQSPSWTIGITTTGTEAVTEDSVRARTGRRFATFGYSGTTTQKRLQSPTLPDSAIRSATSYVVQFYYRTAGGTPPTNLQGGVSPDGTSLSGINQYALVSPMTATGGLWQKTWCTVTSATSGNVPRYGLGYLRFNGSSGVDIDVDDIALYEGNAPDTVSPSASPAVVVLDPTATSLTVRWSRPPGGLDGGGSMVVRGLSDPSVSPLVNGIYDVGNLVAAGQSVIYSGPDTTVVDAGLVPATQYFYRVYAVDKAFNYSTGAAASGTTSAGAIVSAASGNWRAASTWVGGVVPSAADAVRILSGHTVVVDTSGLGLLTVTVDPGGRLWASSPRTTPRYLRVYGPSVTNNGMMGGATDALSFECAASVVFQGSGTDSVCRIRPLAGVSGISMTIDKDMTIVYNGAAGTGGAGLYASNSANDDIAITLTAGHTLTFVPGSRLSVSPHLHQDPTPSVAADVTFSIDGHLILTDGSLGLETYTGRTTTVTVQGRLEIGQGIVAQTSLVPPGTVTLIVGTGGTVVLTGARQATSDLMACSVAVHGVFRSAHSSIVVTGDRVVTGTGSFVLDSAAILQIGSPEGIAQVGSSGNIQTAVRVFSSAGSYVYNGLVHQITGAGLPDQVRGLTIDDSAGVTVTSGITVTDTLAVRSGDLDLNGNTITLGPAGYLVETPGNTVAGSLGSLTTIRTLNNPAGEDIAGLGIHITSAADLGVTSLTRGHAVHSGPGGESVRRYIDLSATTNTGLDATLTLRYDVSELNGLQEENLSLYRSTDGGGTWMEAGGSVNPAGHTLTLTGVHGLSRWTGAEAGGSLGSFAVDVPVAAGWNMIANPVGTSRDSVLQLFPTSMLAHAYSFDPAAGYALEYRLRNGGGYWGKFATGTTQRVAGLRRLRDSIVVSEGWNLVGGISDPVDTAAITSIPDGLRGSDWFGYAGGYSPAPQLLPGRSYWVKANATGVFVFTRSSHQAPSNDLGGMKSEDRRVQDTD